MTQCHRIGSFWRGSLSDADAAAYQIHAAHCELCRAVLALLEEAERPDLGDRAREVLCGAIGAVGLAREIAGWVVRWAVRAVTPAPVREWIDWQQRATWRVR